MFLLCAKDINAIGKHVSEVFIQLCPFHLISSTIAKYKNNIFSLFEVSQMFIYAFCLSNVYFEIRKMELVILIKTVLKSFLRIVRFISSMEWLIKG